MAAYINDMTTNKTANQTWAPIEITHAIKQASLQTKSSEVFLPRASVLPNPVSIETIPECTRETMPDT